MKKTPKKSQVGFWKDEMRFLLQSNGGGKKADFFRDSKILHPGRLTAGTYSHHPFFPRKMIWTKPLWLCSSRSSSRAHYPFLQPISSTETELRNVHIGEFRNGRQLRAQGGGHLGAGGRNFPISKAGVVCEGPKKLTFRKGGTPGGLIFMIFGWWWLNQPIWKICSSKGIISPNFRGENKKMFELPPPSSGLMSFFSRETNSSFLLGGRCWRWYSFCAY